MTEKSLVYVEFRLWNVENRGDIVPVLLGSSPDLGLWKLENGTRARFLKKLDFWSVEKRLPVYSFHEWKWAMVTGNEGRVDWELCPNRRLELGVIGGTVDCDWNSPGKFQQAECLLFAATNYKTDTPSDALALLGSTPSLGEWNPFCGVVAVEYPLGSGWWVARAVVEKGTRHQWKWAVIDENRVVKRWEERSNRGFEASDEMVELNAQWNCDSVVEDFEDDVEPLTSCYYKGKEAVDSCEPMQRYGY
ncbi:uncharacterized protein LOC125373349 [Haliotis rufescens]|uniref:uncharacterized protein LOC125373349 n=1 Tax=Haliotis rufescens TaxID=6454 RepID=UPI00201E978F|nr:uncharacterized protein LOC125373349 [Haliotis rufescens]